MPPANYREAIESFRQALDCLERDAGGRPELLGSGSHLAVHVRSCIAWSLSELGDFVTALEYTGESVRVADEIGVIGNRMGARLYFGMVCNRKGEYEQAVPLLERAYELMEMANLRVGTGFNGLTGSLGTAYLRVGRVSEAIPLLEQGRAQSLAQQAISDLFIGAPALAEAYLIVGRPEAALEVAQEAVDLASEQGKRGFLGWQLLALAEVEAGREPADLDAAEARFQEAFAIAQALEMRPLLARCHLGLGTLYRQAGRLDEARTEMSTAVAMFREMEMTYWLPEAEVEPTSTTAPR